MQKEWFTALELAGMGLPGMPETERSWQRLAKSEGWQRPELQWTADNSRGVWRSREGRGGGVEYHYSVLPAMARAKLVVQQEKLRPADDDRAAVKERLARDMAWAQHDKASDAARDRAALKLRGIQAVEQLVITGMSKDAAVRLIGAEQGFSAASYYGWEGRIAGVAREDRLAYLMDRYTGRGVDTSNCSDEAWEFIKADYLRPEGRAFEVCYRALTHVAASNGWTIPNGRTLLRRIEREIPVVVRVLKREGLEALKRMFPAQERDRSMFHAMEAVNVDGHTFDVFVKWPDGTIGRPCLVAFQDLYSGLMLSWRVDRSENKELVRLAIGDMVQRWGIPDHCWLDNGRAFASKWITGGIANRYRFKVREEEPSGLLTDLDVKVHWTTPYHGQSKPIERAWKDFCLNIATDVRLAGAYTGNNPMAKPENYGERAVPIEDFLKVLAWGVHEHNTRLKRDTKVCGGKLSFQQVFDASYAQAPIRKATPQQYRLWLLAAEGVTARKVDGSVFIERNRYWAEFLSQHRGDKLVVRFDPQDLHSEVHLYSLSGVYLGVAECVEAAGFADVAKAREHTRTRNAWVRAVKEQAKAEVTLSVQEMAEMMPNAPEETAPPVPASIIRPVFGNLAVKAVPAQPDEDRQDEVLIHFGRAMERLRLVEND